MKKLFTHEDSKFFHIHKITGVSVLIHFAYRFYIGISDSFVNKTMYFNPNINTLLSILLHASLHITSFQFLLPQKRNFSYNIIFPEMRLHSAIFAYRALLCMLINIYFNELQIIRGLIAFVTMIAADSVTVYYKNINNDTKNGTTIRDNAYKEGILKKYSKQINLLYSVAQIYATLNTIFANTEGIFLTLLPIQIAPFLMTLEKKGLISQTEWHIFYTLSLLSNIYWSYYYGIVTIPLQQYHIFSVIVIIGRLYFNINKYILWLIPIIVNTLIY